MPDLTLPTLAATHRLRVLPHAIDLEAAHPAMVEPACPAEVVAAHQGAEELLLPAGVAVARSLWPCCFPRHAFHLR